ncbi:hypothetical protein MASR2M29_17300 [Spirochaetota bacterium]
MARKGLKGLPKETKEEQMPQLVIVPFFSGAKRTRKPFNECEGLRRSAYF